MNKPKTKPTPTAEPLVIPVVEVTEAPLPPLPATEPIALVRCPEIPELGVSPVALLTKTFAHAKAKFEAGGSYHLYRSLVYNTDGTIASPHEVLFHEGPLSTLPGPNGIADTTLLSILAHRIGAFQAGPFACEENAKALEHILAAIQCLNDRTLERQARGVQGEHAA